MAIWESYSSRACSDLQDSSVKFIRGFIYQRDRQHIFCFTFLRFYNFNPVTNGAELSFQGSIDSGSNYNVEITSLRVYAYSDEGDSATALGYDSTNHQSNDTGFQSLSDNTGSGADENGNGTLTIFAPSDTTYVKHFIAQFTTILSIAYQRADITTGYFNTTSAIDAFQIKASTGNFDAIIALYGVA